MTTATTTPYQAAPVALTAAVRKRDGVTVQPWDWTKIATAIRKAAGDVGKVLDPQVTAQTVNLVMTTVFPTDPVMIGGAMIGEPPPTVDVEQIQDAVEVALMRYGLFDVAKAYILYRQQRAEARAARKAPDRRAAADYIHASKYARWSEALGRREVYAETVARVEDMHLRRFAHVPGLEGDIRKAFDMVRAKKVLPSMRALANDTIVPTPTGWKEVNAVQVGDELFAQDGRPTKVCKVLKFDDVELFDVMFSDGSTLRACGEHLWVTSTLDDRVDGRTRVVSTDTVAATLTQRSGTARYPHKYNHAVWNSAPLQLPNRELPLDPYILGLWLGDGFSRSGQFACHPDDAEVRQAYAAAGFPVSGPAPSNECTWGTHGLATVLRAMGLRDNKHVPPEYLRAGFEQRLALLQGLMDSDGHTTPEGRSSFTNASPALLDGCAELLSSLGIKFTAKGPDRNAPHHQDKYTYSFFTALSVHRLTRKLANVRDDHRASNRYRTITNVVPVGRGPATCFVVDSASHTFLAGPQMIVTHNCMQFGGAAVEAVNSRMFNCCATLIDRPRVFAEALYLLLGGSGIGYSVQFDHVAKLPSLVAEIDRKRVLHHVIGDTIKGWADALDALMNSYFVGGQNEGSYVEYAYHEVRDAGVILKTSGGRAPGHMRLKEALERIRAILDGARGRKLRPIECHRILCHAADAVLSGGIRRSAMICLFSLDDGELMHCKADSGWFDREPWLQNANNSVVLKRGDVTEKQFRRIFEATKRYGEPGIVFVDDYDHVGNPCQEIMFIVKFGGETGWGMCNLTEMNAAEFKTADDFKQAVWAATLIGTLQAAYTDFPYLGEVTEKIVRRDALLGVGMTGMQHAPKIALDPDLQREMAEQATAWNLFYARLIGINRAARVTCIKPSGTTTLELDLDCSGIHRAHARRFIRRVTADELEVPFQAFRKVNPHMCVRKPDGKWVIEFPREVDEGTLLKEDQSAVDFLGDVLSTQRNWVIPGTAREQDGLHHNVSNTIQVRPHEWDEIAAAIWRHRDELTGISLVPDMLDTIYPFSPFEAVKTPAQEARWNELVAHYKPVDYENVMETEDGTALSGEVACAGGACEVKW